MFKKVPTLIFFFLIFFVSFEDLHSKDGYFLTLRNEKVNLRQGPSFDYPIKILYKKKFLPVLIQDSSDNFRKIRDHENNSGWIHISQLSKKKAAIVIEEELILFGTVSLIMLYLSAVGIYFFEHEAQPTHFASVFHSLWWATTTLTTVGYGDVYPITLGGRCFTFVVLLIGLGIISIPAGIVASALAKAREIEDK